MNTHVSETRAPADSYTLLREEQAADRMVAAARVALARRDPPEECPMYLAAVRRAVAAEPPPFCTNAYAKIYRRSAADPRWMIVSLMANAQREGQGATDLWTLAACAEDDDEQRQVKRHAVDESNHAKAYLALLDLAFPGAITPAFRAELDVVSPGYTMAHEPHPVPGSDYAKNPTIDDYVQMNIAEIRTTIHHLMQRAALEAHCPDDNRLRVTRLLDALLRDELKHVAYTAVLIERKAPALGEDRLIRLYSKRLRDFNRITNEEFGEDIYD